MKTLIKLALGAALVLGLLLPLSSFPGGPFPQPNCTPDTQNCPAEIPQ